MINPSNPVYKRLSYSSCLFFFSAFLFYSCSSPKEKKALTITTPSVLVLGTIQDAGSPQAACNKSCCVSLHSSPDLNRKVTCLGLIEPNTGNRYLFEASPDFKEQLQVLNQMGKQNKFPWPDGIFLTHAHMGHYTGLLHLGKEAMNSKAAALYVLPGMKRFLEKNAPWSQLCSMENIHIQLLKADSAQTLAGGLSVTALKVPHRDEFSETGAFLIKGPNKTLLFIPDIDKWEKWERNIVELIKSVDYALLDGTFYSADEIQHRKLAEIPHPLVRESLQLFDGLNREDKNKIYFIHFNHTNPLLDSNSLETQKLKRKGFHLARYKQVFPL